MIAELPSVLLSLDVGNIPSSGYNVFIEEAQCTIKSERGYGHVLYINFTSSASHVSPFTYQLSPRNGSYTNISAPGLAYTFVSSISTNLLLSLPDNESSKFSWSVSLVLPSGMSTVIKTSDHYWLHRGTDSKRSNEHAPVGFKH